MLTTMNVGHVGKTQMDWNRSIDVKLVIRLGILGNIDETMIHLTSSFLVRTKCI